jgi:hypothetical protein
VEIPQDKFEHIFPVLLLSVDCCLLCRLLSSWLSAFLPGSLLSCALLSCALLFAILLAHLPEPAHCSGIHLSAVPHVLELLSHFRGHFTAETASASKASAL